MGAAAFFLCAPFAVKLCLLDPLFRRFLASALRCVAGR